MYIKIIDQERLFETTLVILMGAKL